MLFDTHAHMDDRAFDTDRETLLADLPNQGIALLMNPGCSLESSRNVDKLTRQYDYIYGAVGSHPDVADEVNEFPEVTGVFHCYSGSAEMAKELVKRGWYIGFTGVLTFKNARKAIEVASSIPLDRIVLETDCPYMSPEPFRGKRNDPGKLYRMAEKLAEIKGMTVEEIHAVTVENGKRLYRI